MYDFMYVDTVELFTAIKLFNMKPPPIAEVLCVLRIVKGYNFSRFQV